MVDDVTGQAYMTAPTPWHESPEAEVMQPGLLTSILSFFLILTFSFSLSGGGHGFLSIHREVSPTFSLLSEPSP
jgi:hypothetical protein